MFGQISCNRCADILFWRETKACGRVNRIGGLKKMEVSLFVSVSSTRRLLLRSCGRLVLEGQIPRRESNITQASVARNRCSLFEQYQRNAVRVYLIDWLR